MREEKSCPDCAEMVLAQARVCRFCGYRFERRSPPRGPLEWIRMRPDVRSLPELLLDWDIELREAESVAFFGHCSHEGGGAYLLVTTDRVACVAERGSAKLLEWPIDELRGVEVGAQRRRGWIRLSGAGGEVTLRQFDSAAALATAAEHLRSSLR